MKIRFLIVLTVLVLVATDTNASGERLNACRGAICPKNVPTLCSQTIAPYNANFAFPSITAEVDDSPELIVPKLPPSKSSGIVPKLPTTGEVGVLPLVPGSSKIPQRDKKLTGYTAFLRRIEMGEKLTLAVGVIDLADDYVSALDGFSPGVYRCFLENGKPVMSLVQGHRGINPVARGGVPTDPKGQWPVISPATTKGTRVQNVDTLQPQLQGHGSFAGGSLMGSTSMNAHYAVPGGITNSKCDSGG